MRKVLVMWLIFSWQQVMAQDFPGYRTGNYTGVNGVFYNPANIADSRYRLDVNLFSVSTYVGNNQATFNLRNSLQAFNADSLENQLLGYNAGLSTGLISLAIQGPSILFNVSSRDAIALTTRGRTIANVVDVEGRLASELTDRANNNQLPFTINARENMRIAMNAWSEIGISYGRVLQDQGRHFFKTGLSLKYLSGISNGYVNSNNFKSTIDQESPTGDVYLANTTGRLVLGFSGVRVGDFEITDLANMENRGFGFDLGFVYEFRPGYEDFTNNNSNGGKGNKGSNKYKLRLGVALLDIGKIKYERDRNRSGAYDLNITESERLNIQDLQNVEIDDYNAYFLTRPELFQPVAGSTDPAYKVSLPSTLQLNADYHLRGGLYVSLDGQLPLTTAKKNVYDPRYYGSYTLTPRFETKGFGFYLPLNHSTLTGWNAGASLRFGPLFVGSGSVLSALIGDSKQADLQVGLRFGGLK